MLKELWDEIFIGFYLYLTDLASYLNKKPKLVRRLATAYVILKNPVQGIKVIKMLIDMRKFEKSLSKGRK
jgi:hypothetical protein